MVPGALDAGGVRNSVVDGFPVVRPVDDIGADLLGGTAAVFVRVDGGEADMFLTGWVLTWGALFAAAWRRSDTNGDLVDPIGPVQAHGSVEEIARVAVFFSSLGISSLGVDHTLVVLGVPWVGTGLDAASSAALPGVHLVVPAIVVKLDRPEQGVDATLVCGMDAAVVVNVFLDAEVAESALVERVLVDSAALVGGSLVVNLVLEASNGTERSALTVA